MNSVSNEEVARNPNEVAHELTADERAALDDADVDPDAVIGKQYSYRLLLDAGVDPAVATDIRRRFSLPWSFDADGDLDRRSAEVRGLGEAEREWVAVSATEDWQAFEAARSRADEAADEEQVERTWERPTPVGDVPGVGPSNAKTLATGGINSAERLATIDAAEIARVLDLDVRHVRTWRFAARELLRE